MDAKTNTSGPQEPQPGVPVDTTVTWGKALRLRKRSLLLGASRWLLRQAFRVHRRAKRLYEPVLINGHRYEGRRPSDERWQAIASVLQTYSANNVLDIGCAEGWFLRRAATELGCFAVGVEASERLLAGEIARLHDNAERLAILRTRATAGDIRKLPKFDVVICLSVVHHVFRRHGTAAAEDFIRALADRAEKAVIFEMGTSEEKGLKWAGDLSAMPEGQEAYVKGLLERCGLTNVRPIASTPAFHGQASRVLFAAETKPS